MSGSRTLGHLWRDLREPESWSELDSKVSLCLLRSRATSVSSWWWEVLPDGSFRRRAGERVGFRRPGRPHGDQRRDGLQLRCKHWRPLHTAAVHCFSLPINCSLSLSLTPRSPPTRSRLSGRRGIRSTRCGATLMACGRWPFTRWSRVWSLCRRTTRSNCGTSPRPFLPRSRCSRHGQTRWEQVVVHLWRLLDPTVTPSGHTSDCSSVLHSPLLSCQ